MITAEQMSRVYSTLQRDALFGVFKKQEALRLSFS